MLPQIAGILKSISLIWDKGHICRLPLSGLPRENFLPVWPSSQVRILLFLLMLPIGWSWWLWNFRRSDWKSVGQFDRKGKRWCTKKIQHKVCRRSERKWGSHEQVQKDNSIITNLIKILPSYHKFKLQDKDCKGRSQKKKICLHRKKKYH